MFTKSPYESTTTVTRIVPPTFASTGSITFSEFGAYLSATYSAGNVTIEENTFLDPKTGVADYVEVVLSVPDTVDAQGLWLHTTELLGTFARFCEEFDLNERCYDIDCDEALSCSISFEPLKPIIVL